MRRLPGWDTGRRGRGALTGRRAIVGGGAVLVRDRRPPL